MQSNDYKGYEAIFTEADRDKTILIPWFADFLSPMIPAIGKLAGYRLVNCPRTTKTSADIGLQYGNNEVCYPATLVLGDLIAEIQSGRHDTAQLAVAITQTGGQCRATNYIALIKTGLEAAGLGHIPVIAVSLGGAINNRQPGFKLPLRRILMPAVYAFLFGDFLQQIYSATVVREQNEGESSRLFDLYMSLASDMLLQKKPERLLALFEEAVSDFNRLEVRPVTKIEKVGVIGEIFVKYNDYGQAYITRYIRSQGFEAVIPSMLPFFMQAFVNQGVNCRNGIVRTPWLIRKLMPLFYRLLQRRITLFDRKMQAWRYYCRSETVFELAHYAGQILDLSNQFGEGWMIAADVASFDRQGITRVVCLQPFGCIANHIVAKGIERRLKLFYPRVNLLYLDIDGGMAEVNLHNRIQFLLANANL